MIFLSECAPQVKGIRLDIHSNLIKKKKARVLIPGPPIKRVRNPQFECFENRRLSNYPLFSKS